MAVLIHPYRTCLYDEAKEMASGYKNLKKTINDQVKQYREDGMPDQQGLYGCSMLIRRGDKNNVIKHCELWWEEVKKYSPRDQISFPYVLWKYNLVNLQKLSWKLFEDGFYDKKLHKNDIKRYKKLLKTRKR